MIRTEVEFPRKEREVLELLRSGLPTKLIAGALEICANTVRDRIRASCDRAQVVNESELLLFLLQHPGILTKGARCAPGLHIPVMRDTVDPNAGDGDEFPDCQCGNPECLGWVAMKLKTA